MYIFVPRAVWNCSYSLHTAFAVTGPPQPPAVCSNTLDSALGLPRITDMRWLSCSPANFRTVKCVLPWAVTQNFADISGDALLMVVGLKWSQSRVFWFFIMPGCLCTEPSGQSVCFVLSRSTALVAHKNPASPGTSRDNYHVRGNKITYVKCKSHKPVHDPRMRSCRLLRISRISLRNFSNIFFFSLWGIFLIILLRY